MDIGQVVIHHAGGVPRVVRCEAGPGGGLQFVPATNTAELTATLRGILVANHVDLGTDGVFPCPREVYEAARFEALTLPGDLITLREAKDRLYPELSYNAGFAQIYRDITAGRLQPYHVGGWLDGKRLVSRAAVERLAASPAQRTRGRRAARATPE
jgi:hypothetical protein